MKITDIIIKPYITEKTTQMVKSNVYTFEVSEDANKNQITDAVKNLFDVTIGDIKTEIKKGRTKRIGKLRKVQLVPKKRSPI